MCTHSFMYIRVSLKAAKQHELHELTSTTIQYMAFGISLKIHKKFKFDWNQLKLDTQHKNMYMYQKKL